MSMEKVETEMPWWDSTKWTTGEWYPMPIGFMERDNEGYIIDGYMVFELDNPKNGDIAPALPATFTFSTALKICEEKNNRRMIE